METQIAEIDRYKQILKKLTKKEHLFNMHQFHLYEGKVVKYGDYIQLKHYNDKGFVTGEFKVSYEDKSAYRLFLSKRY